MPLRQSQADNFEEEDREHFVDFSSNFMFKMWKSRHEDIKLFDLVSNTVCKVFFIQGPSKMCLEHLQFYMLKVPVPEQNK